MHFRLLSITLLAVSLPSLPAQVNVLTVHNDRARTGQNRKETILTTSNVNFNTFGKLFLAALDGVVDAQPLYVSSVSVPNQGTHNLLIVATENDSLYALDAGSGAQIWKTSLLPSGEVPSDDRNCGQVTPTIGITSTPVISLDEATGNGVIFAVAMSKNSSGTYHQRLHKVSLATGTKLDTVLIAGRYPGTGESSSGGSVIFEPGQYKERAGLLLLRGVVYLGWASHCDDQPYTGWVMGYDAKTLTQVSLINVTPNGGEGAIWGAGAGMSADSDGYIYLLDANGTFDRSLNAQGFPANGDFGNAFIKLSAANNVLSVVDYFTMDNTVSESDSDTDFGSGGSMVLPDMTDASGTVRHLAVGAGKDGNLYLVNRENMGKFNHKNDKAIYQQLSGALSGGIWSMPAYYKDTIYYGPVSSPIMAFQFSHARLASTPVSSTSTQFAYPGASPSISANGDSEGILWAVENNSPAVLHAYSASNLATELYNTSQAPNDRDTFGSGNKFMVPTIVNGMVYVGTPNGVAGFGLLSH